MDAAETTTPDTIFAAGEAGAGGPLTLTAEEHGWAISLRDALEKADVQRPPGGDFMLAQFALISSSPNKRWRWRRAGGTTGVAWPTR